MVTTRTGSRQTARSARRQRQPAAASEAQIRQVHEGSFQFPDSDSASISHAVRDSPAATDCTATAGLHDSLPSSSNRPALADLQAQSTTSQTLRDCQNQHQQQQQPHKASRLSPNLALEPLIASGQSPGRLSAGRKGSKGNSRHRASATHAGLIGRIVDVPADVFSVEIPDMYYRGLITKRDYGHKDSFEVKFEEDGSRYWLPIADCQRWLDQMEARGRTELSETIGAASDNFAASVLAGFAGSARSRCGQQLHAPVSSASAGNFSHARSGRLMKCASEPDISNLQKLAAAV